jgi:hypothetical protein
MWLKQSFADQVKAQSEVWKAQIKEYQEQLEQEFCRSGKGAIGGLEGADQRVSGATRTGECQDPG